MANGTNNYGGGPDMNSLRNTRNDSLNLSPIKVKSCSEKSSDLFNDSSSYNRNCNYMNNNDNNFEYLDTSDKPMVQIESPKSRMEIINDRQELERCERKSKILKKKAFENVFQSNNLEFKDTTIGSLDYTVQDVMGSNQTKLGNSNERTRTTSKEGTIEGNSKEGK